jgi:hypothetical protein
MRHEPVMLLVAAEAAASAQKSSSSLLSWHLHGTTGLAPNVLPLIPTALM